MANASDSAGEGAFGFVQDFAADMGDKLLNATTMAGGKTVEEVARTNAGDVPIIGSAISGIESAYHLAAAGYDIATGDRDGAIAHGTKGIVDAAMVVPGVNKLFGTADKVLSYGGAGAKVAMALGGASGEATEAIPTGVDDVAASAAVTLANTFFGADEDKGTGTAAGEMATGFGGMGAMMNVGAGPIGMALGAAAMAMGGNEYAKVTDGKKATEPGSTSGNDPGFFAKLGQSWHAGLFD